jgi:hypothetical protein
MPQILFMKDLDNYAEFRRTRRDKGRRRGKRTARGTVLGTTTSGRIARGVGAAAAIGGAGLLASKMGKKGGGAKMLPAVGQTGKSTAGKLGLYNPNPNMASRARRAAVGARIGVTQAGSRAGSAVRRAGTRAKNATLRRMGR